MKKNIGSKLALYPMPITVIGAISGAVAGSVNALSGVFSRVEDLGRDKDSVADEVGSLSGVSEENAASAEEASISVESINNSLSGIAVKTENLAAVVQKLQEAIAVFKIK